MLKKLIIFILFLVITVVAIGFVSLPDFKFATQVKMGDEANIELDKATSATVIDIPVAPAFIKDVDKIQIVFAFDESGTGYLELITDSKNEAGLYTKAYYEAAVLLLGHNYISGASVLMWLFFLLMIILLPRKHGKKKIKKLARTVAEDVVDEEMDNMMPPQRYAPPPRAPRAQGGEGRRRRSADYEDDDYDY